MMDGFTAQTIARSLGLKDPRVLALVAKLASARPIKICDFVDAEDKLYICLQIGETEHVTVEAKGIDTALRKATLMPVK